MGKKVLVLGTGAQGTTVAKRLDLEPNVDKIICADYDEAAAKELAGGLKKAEGFFCDASDKAQIVHDVLFGPVVPQVPASVLQLHPNVTFIVDSEAGSKIKDKL